MSLSKGDGSRSHDSPRLGVDLSELNLVGHYNLATLVEDQKPRACRALVYGPDEGLGSRRPICTIGTVSSICSIWNVDSVCAVRPIHDASMLLED